LHAETSQDGVFSLTPIGELEFLAVPEFFNLAKGNFDLLLFVGGFSDFFDILDQVKHFGLGQVFDDEDVRLVVGDSVLGLLVERLPMSILDGVLLENGDDWQNDLQVFNRGLQLLVGLPALEILGQTGAQLSVSLRGFFHRCKFFNGGFGPEKLLESIDRVDNFTVEIVELLQVNKLSLGFLQSRVLLALQSEQLLTFLVDLVLLFPDFVLFVESFESLNGLFGRDAFDHGTVLLIVGSELSDVLDQFFDVLLQFFEIFSLFDGQVLSDLLALFDQIVPAGVQQASGVHFVLIVDASGKVIIQESVHIHDGVEADVNHSLQFSDFLEFFHHNT